MQFVVYIHNVQVCVPMSMHAMARVQLWMLIALRQGLSLSLNQLLIEFFLAKWSDGKALRNSLSLSSNTRVLGIQPCPAFLYQLLDF